MIYLITYKIAVKLRESNFIELLNRQFDYLSLLPNSCVIRTGMSATEILKAIETVITPGADAIFIAPFSINECDGYIPAAKIDWILDIKNDSSNS